MTEHERLSLYLLGALDEAERESFEEHLAGCWQCLNEAAEIGPSTSGLVGLGDADWSQFIDEPSEPPTAAGSGAVKHNDGPGGPVRPAGARPGAERPSAARPAPARAGSRRRRLKIWASAMVAAAALVLSGGVVAVNQWGVADASPVTASGEAPGYGASLSVQITPADKGSSTIRITVTGLRPGIRYRLFAVTRDGATHVVRDWTASSGPQKVAGETSLSVDDLSFITVGLVDGSAIVTAPLQGS